MAISQRPYTCSALIVAAGSSSRMGFDKLAADLSGQPVLKRTIAAFLASDAIESIVVVCPQDRWEKLLADTSFSKPVTRINGGANRQDSVAAGLAVISSSYVAVHDAARPLIRPEAIEATIAAAYVHQSAALARRVTETLKRSDDHGFSAGAVERENLWFMETPQVMSSELLRKAYETVTSENLAITDEVSALEAIGVRVKLVESAFPNIKITTPADLILAAALIS